MLLHSEKGLRTRLKSRRIRTYQAKQDNRLHNYLDIRQPTNLSKRYYIDPFAADIYLVCPG